MARAFDIRFAVGDHARWRAVHALDRNGQAAPDVGPSSVGKRGSMALIVDAGKP